MYDSNKGVLASEKAKEVAEALADFVIRASQKGATPEEVAALPSVANVLMGYSFPSELPNFDVTR